MNFTVLLSVYFKEQPKFLTQSLDSIFHQSLLPNEIILVIDGPLTTELENIIYDYENRYPILKVVRLKKNLGLGIALNEGLKHCSYDLIARMDTDDIACYDRFEKQVSFMVEHPDIDACSSWIYEFEGSINNVTSIKKLPEFNEEIRKYAKYRNPFNHPVVMFRKEAVINAGGYKHFFLFEDYYLWVRMIMNGSKLYNIQESLLYFRFTPEMIKRRGGWKYFKSEIRLQKEFHNMGFIGLSTLLYNTSIRIIIRMIPNIFREFIYRKFLRKK